MARLASRKQKEEATSSVSVSVAAGADSASILVSSGSNPMTTDDHQTFKRKKTSSSKPTGADAASLLSSSSMDKMKTDKKKRISSPMATADHQPFKRLKTSSSMPTTDAASNSLLSSCSKDKKKRISKDKKKRISSSMAADDHQPFKRPKTSSSTPAISTDWGRWGELPNDVLSLILQKLILQDQLRLSCVCVAWNLAVRGGGGGGYRPSPIPQLPWLMIPGAGRDRTSAKFISLSEHRTYDIPLPHPPIRKRLCVGSSHGWLVTLYKLSEMHLLNPITSVQIPLPAITTTLVTAATTYPSGYTRIGSCSQLDAFLGKAILSSAPARDGTGDFTIFLIRSMPMSSYRSLAIARIGDDAWTTFPDEFIFDIMYHKGQLLIQGVRGLIHVWEQQQQQHDHRLSFVPRFTIDTGDLRHNNIPFVLTDRKIVYSRRKHLVQSMTGELFIVCRTMTPHVPIDEETKFKIARLDLDRNEYVPVDDSKDIAFFVGINNSIVVSATKFPEVKRNSVYFTRYNFVFTRTMKNIPSQSPPISTGVFDVEKESSSELLDSIASHLTREEKKHIGSLMDWPPIAWVAPTLF